MRIGVLGAGSWGTSLANLLVRNGHSVVIWAREPEVVAGINQESVNAVFLPDCDLAPELQATESVADALEGAELVVSAAPSHAVRAVGQAAAAVLGKRQPVVVSVSKGLEPETHLTMTDVLAEVLHQERIVALSGPSFALEVYQEMPTAVVAASHCMEAAEEAQLAFSSTTFRVYTGTDVLGVQLGGALKNVVAIAAGIVEGLGFGHNTRAALITRGLAEMTRLGEALGASPRTFSGLAGMGDLILTTTGGLSRNRTLGLEMGRGKTLQAALAGKKTVAEGVNTARVAVEVAKRAGVEMPIALEVERILFEDKAPQQAISDLMERELKAELWQ